MNSRPFGLSGWKLRMFTDFSGEAARMAATADSTESNSWLGAYPRTHANRCFRAESKLTNCAILNRRASESRMASFSWPSSERDLTAVAAGAVRVAGGGRFGRL